MCTLENLSEWLIHHKRVYEMCKQKMYQYVVQGWECKWRNCVKNVQLYHLFHRRGVLTITYVSVIMHKRCVVTLGDFRYRPCSFTGPQTYLTLLSWMVDIEFGRLMYSGSKGE